jgi:ubiquitin C-terminal hydrolase
MTQFYKIEPSQHVVKAINLWLTDPVAKRRQNIHHEVSKPLGLFYKEEDPDYFIPIGLELNSKGELIGIIFKNVKTNEIWLKKITGTPVSTKIKLPNSKAQNFILFDKIQKATYGAGLNFQLENEFLPMDSDQFDAVVGVLLDEKYKTGKNFQPKIIFEKFIHPALQQGFIVKELFQTEGETPDVIDISPQALSLEDKIKLFMSRFDPSERALNSVEYIKLERQFDPQEWKITDWVPIETNCLSIPLNIHKLVPGEEVRSIQQYLDNVTFNIQVEKNAENKIVKLIQHKFELSSYFVVQFLSDFDKLILNPELVVNNKKFKEIGIVTTNQEYFVLDVPTQSHKRYSKEGIQVKTVNEIPPIIPSLIFYKYADEVAPVDRVPTVAETNIINLEKIFHFNNIKTVRTIDDMLAMGIPNFGNECWANAFINLLRYVNIVQSPMFFKALMLYSKANMDKMKSMGVNYFPKSETGNSYIQLVNELQSQYPNFTPIFGDQNSQLRTQQDISEFSEMLSQNQFFPATYLAEFVNYIVPFIKPDTCPKSCLNSFYVNEEPNLSIKLDAETLNMFKSIQEYLNPKDELYSSVALYLKEQTENRFKPSNTINIQVKVTDEMAPLVTEEYQLYMSSSDLQSIKQNSKVKNLKTTASTVSFDFEVPNDTINYFPDSLFINSFLHKMRIDLPYLRNLLVLRKCDDCQDKTKFPCLNFMYYELTVKVPFFVINLQLLRWKKLAKWNVATMRPELIKTERDIIEPNFKVNLDLILKCQDKTTARYSLRGMAVHQGTHNSGHYTTYLRYKDEDFGNVWKLYDDSTIKEANLAVISSLLNKGSYREETNSSTIFMKPTMLLYTLNQ